MTKKKASAQPQNLSPENYIRQKARNLPVYKCWINDNWKDNKIANIIIARQHTNGNVTFCFYLVDLYCLGVKDTFYAFNVPIEELEHKMSQYSGVKMEESPYTLVHNIIFSAIEFAEEYGFKPHKNFILTTNYFLEEDTDDIPLMYIECGDEDGKPIYWNTGNDSPAVEKRILAQLEKTAGEGNYNYTLRRDSLDEDEEEDDDYDDFDEEDEDDFDEDEDFDEEDIEEILNIIRELDQLSKEQRIALYFEYEKKIDNLSDDMLTKFGILMRVLADDFIDAKAVENYREILWKDLNYPAIDIEEFPESLFSGLQDIDIDETYELLFYTVDALEGTKKEAQKAIAEFRDELGDVPIVYFVELLYLEQNKKKEYAKKIEEYHTKFPDYFLIKLKWFNYLYDTHNNIFQKNIALQNINSLLSKSKHQVSIYEFHLFILNYLLLFFSDENTPALTDRLNRAVAFENFIAATMDESTPKELIHLISDIKTDTIAKIMKQKQ
jgi:hypothetical protein